MTEEAGRAGVSIDPELLEVVVCPDCRSTLRVEDAPGDRGADPAVELVCQGCGLAYPVRDHVPVLLVDEAVRR